MIYLEVARLLDPPRIWHCSERVCLILTSAQRSCGCPGTFLQGDGGLFRQSLSVTIAAKLAGMPYLELDVNRGYDPPCRFCGATSSSEVATEKRNRCWVLDGKSPVSNGQGCPLHTLGIFVRDRGCLSHRKCIGAALIDPSRWPPPII
jgi:hypothetical protein